MNETETINFTTNTDIFAADFPAIFQGFFFTNMKSGALVGPYDTQDEAKTAALHFLELQTNGILYLLTLSEEKLKEVNALLRPVYKKGDAVAPPLVNETYDAPVDNFPEDDYECEPGCSVCAMLKDVNI